VLIGLLLGWTLGIFRQPAFKALVVVSVIGFFYVLLFPGGLSGQVGSVLVNAFGVLSNLVSITKVAPVDVRLLTVAWQGMVSQEGLLAGQVMTWFAALLINPSAYDPLVIGLVWDVLIWFISGWAGWVIVIRKDALLAAFPAFMLSVGLLAYSHRVSSVLYVVMGATLFLLAVAQFDRRKEIWDVSGVAYPRRKGRQITNVALIITIGLVLFSAVLSSISIRRIREWLIEQKASATQNTLIIQAAPANSAMAVTDKVLGQPRDFLITSSPQLSEHVVMTVSVRNLAALISDGQLPPLYWRSASYDVYTGHGWSTSGTQTSSYQANQTIQPSYANGTIPVEQDVFPVENLGGSVYAAGEPVTVSLPSKAAWRSPGDLFGLQAPGSTDYRVYSLVSVADVNELRAAGQNYPDWVRQKFLVLPQGIPARVKALANQLTASKPTAFDKALAIENYLRTYPYSLDIPIPPKQRDLVDYFLFDLKTGYCDYYASAMVVLAREAGIPARLALGYASGTYNINSKRFVVTEADVHSWVEVYFPSVGWVPFEPTAASPRLERLPRFLPMQAPGSILTIGVTNNKLASFLSFDWLLTLGIVVLAAIIGAVLITSSESRLRRLPDVFVVALIYQRLKRYGSRLAVIVDPGATPYEFSVSLRRNLLGLLSGEEWISRGAYLDNAVEELVDGINMISYRSSSQEKMHLVRQWNALRWRLNAVWLLKIWKGILDHLKIKRIPTSNPPL
jgi:hypothetical protein